MNTQLSTNQTILLQYQGFLDTAPLWIDSTIYNNKSFHFPNSHNTNLDFSQTLPTRLGKRVEHFVCHNLAQSSHISILASNLQIQHVQQTIGEIDLLLKSHDETIHLEIVYKFYLYDPTVGTRALDHWIGPNRKDSLIQKLNKLQNKQFPLLHHACTKPYLDKLQVHAESLTQQVLFKAQLFVPFQGKSPEFNGLNPDCVRGFYIKLDQLPSFIHCTFYLPNKLDWLVTPHLAVDWLPYPDFTNQLESLLYHKLAPMVWLKHPDGQLQSCFVVWW